MIKSKGSLKSRVLGVIHLPPLWGSPGAISKTPIGSLEEAGERALRELKLFEKYGFDGVIVENFLDYPFFKTSVPKSTIISLSVLCAYLRSQTNLVLGLNILRNDALSAMEIATLTGFDLIRVNVLSGVVATDQGVIEGCAAKLLRKKAIMGSQVKILADAFVKHGKTMHTNSWSTHLEELIDRGGANGVIVSGATTGRKVGSANLQKAVRVARDLKKPLYLGSGVSEKDIPWIKKLGLGVIVSSSLRKNSQAGLELEEKRLKEWKKSWDA